MKSKIKATMVALVIATPSFAQEHDTVDCLTEIGVGTAGGAAVGTIAGVAAVWTIGILAAPFTWGGSLAGASALTLPAAGLGAKGGAVYGAAGGTAVCVVEELDE